MNNQELTENKSNKTSANSYILNSPQLLNIKDFFKISLVNYIYELYGTNVGVDLKITQSWINHTSKNEQHHSHYHANSFISGVFYIQTNKKQDTIIFHSNKYRQFAFNNQEATIWSTDLISFPAIPGQLILFPSNLMHSVDTLLHDQTRISMSFNTFPFGNLGSELGLTRLNITEVF